MIPKFIVSAAVVLIITVSCNGKHLDCTLVKCVGVECPEGQTPLTTEGHCCPNVCSPNCKLVKCGRPPVCEQGQILTTPPEKCCPVCTGPTCIGILCAALNEEFDCQKGEVLIVPPGECCPRCVRKELDCTLVKCVGVECPKGQTPLTTEGHCCPNVCSPNCKLVKCGRPPICEQGQILTTPPEKCCPVCTQGPHCLGILCAALNEEFDCQKGEVLIVPPGECCPRCIRKELDDCDAECQPGHRCAIDKVTNQKFCNPDCELDNGGCRPDQTCSLEKVDCVKAPCPPVVRCT